MMKLIVCLDEQKGMMFNRRRQSRDRVLIDDVLIHIGGDPLYISNYSSTLFPMKDNIHVVDNPLMYAEETGYCFAEDIIESIEASLP
jgi:hypothetical protein